jgi:hypothetical protein
MTNKLDYEMYKKLREAGLSPIIAKYQWEKSRSEDTMTGLIHAMISVFVGITIMGAFLGIFKKPDIWITSPSGKTTIKLPLHQAMRIVRKQNWKYTEVEPIKPPRKISRLEAFKILITGDKDGTGKKN